MRSHLRARVGLVWMFSMDRVESEPGLGCSPFELALRPRNATALRCSDPALDLSGSVTSEPQLPPPTGKPALFVRELVFAQFQKTSQISPFSCICGLGSLLNSLPMQLPLSRTSRTRWQSFLGAQRNLNSCELFPDNGSV